MRIEATAKEARAWARGRLPLWPAQDPQSWAEGLVVVHTPSAVKPLPYRWNRWPKGAKPGRNVFA